MRGANLYVATPAGVQSALTCGQWVKVDGHRKPARFVKYNADGTAHLVHPTGKGLKARVNMQAFRLACGKPLARVIATATVNASVVRVTATNDVVDLTPLPVGPAEDREAYLEKLANDDAALEIAVNRLGDLLGI